MDQTHPSTEQTVEPGAARLPWHAPKLTILANFSTNQTVVSTRVYNTFPSFISVCKVLNAPYPAALSRTNNVAFAFPGPTATVGTLLCASVTPPTVTGAYAAWHVGGSVNITIDAADGLGLIS